MTPAWAQGPTFMWDASANTNVAGYAVYYGPYSGYYPTRVDAGTNLVVTIPGLDVGATYYFVVTAYDTNGMDSPPSDEISYTMPTINPLTLAVILDQAVNVQQTLVLTNSTFVSGGAATNLTYRLLSAPAGMVIDPTSGVLSWSPSWSQAGSTNAVMVSVSDDSSPPQTSQQTFVVTVGNALSLSLNSAIISIGQNGSATLAISSSSGVTNLSFTLDAPYGWVGNLTVQSLLPNIVVTQNPPGAIHSVITMQTTDGQPLPSQQYLLEVDFNSQPNQTTTTSSLQISAVSAWLANGQPVPTTPGTASPLTFVGADSMLQLQMINGQPALTLYGPIGNTYQIQSTTNLGATGGWTNEFSVTLTNLSQSFPNLSSSGASMKFYRASRQ